jgi:hypothetical protein
VRYAGSDFFGMTGFGSAPMFRSCGGIYVASCALRKGCSGPFGSNGMAGVDVGASDVARG